MTMKVQLPKNHAFLTQSVNIDAICQPLKKFGINIFTYLKNFKNGSQINLSSNSKWLEDYYNLSLYQSSLYENNPEAYRSGFSVWLATDDSPVIAHGRDYFDSYYGMTVTKQQDDGCEFYFFSGSMKNPVLMDFYLNNLDLLERFIIYFKDRAAKLLEQAKQNKIILPRDPINRETKDTNNNLSDLRKEFLKETAMRRYRIESGEFKGITLSKREIDCISALHQGLTADEISRKLFRSKRTIEKHIENIKDKFGCRTKSELVERFINVSGTRANNWLVNWFSN